MQKTETINYTQYLVYCCRGFHIARFHDNECPAYIDSPHQTMILEWADQLN